LPQFGSIVAVKVVVAFFLQACLSVRLLLGSAGQPVSIPVLTGVRRATQGVAPDMIKM